MPLYVLPSSQVGGSIDIRIETHSTEAPPSTRRPPSARHAMTDRTFPLITPAIFSQQSRRCHGRLVHFGTASLPACQPVDD